MTHHYFVHVVERYVDCIQGQNHQSLLRKAERVLSLPYLTVTDKERLPPSNVANDYLSFAPYYWHENNPDPFTKPKIAKFKKDGRPNPALTKLSDKPRLAQMCARVHLLTLAFKLSGDLKYVEYIDAQLRCWFVTPETRMNPHMEFAQIMPWRNHRRGLGIIDARWLILLLDAVAILLHAGALNNEVAKSLSSWIKAFSLWLLRSPAGLFEVAMRNNRGSWIDVLLTYNALALGVEDAALLIAEGGTKNRPQEQFNELMMQPFEMQRYTFVSYSLYNIYPLYYLFNFLKWKKQSEKDKTVVKNLEREVLLLDKAVSTLQTMIPPHEMNKIEAIDFDEAFSLNLYYPYCFSQLQNFPGIYPFPSDR